MAIEPRLGILYIIGKLSRFWKILLFFPLTGNADGGGGGSEGRARGLERMNIKRKSG